MTIDRPVFLLGSGRSGTTVLYHLLSSHPELCWFSNYSNLLHWLPFIPLSQRFLHKGASGSSLARDAFSKKGRKLSVRPDEGKKLYKKAGLPHSRILTEFDHKPEVEARFKKIIERHLNWSGRTRFLSKDTANNQRYRLLNRMFPDALFVHLVRDGRAVTNSIRAKNWLPTIEMWWMEDKAINHINEYEDPIELIGLHWQHNVEELLMAKELVGDRYLELRYESLVDDVRGTIMPIIEFAGLDSSEEWIASLPEKLPNMNEKWRQVLTIRQIELLQNIISPTLMKLGYNE